MKKHFAIILILFICLTGTLSAAKELSTDDELYIEAADNTLAYCMALKNGDLNTIRQFLSKSVYNKNRTLLQDNREYSNFLKNYYDGAEFNINRIEKSGDNINVEIMIGFRDGHQSMSEFRFSRNESSQWKISEQIYE